MSTPNQTDETILLANRLADLTKKIVAVCPIGGVHADDWDDKSTWKCWFKKEATKEQKAAAQAVIDNFSFEDYAIQEKIAEIKKKAAELILDEVPEHKQRNLTAKWLELSDKKSLTATEKAEKADIKATWAWIQSVRDHSNAMEAALKKNEAVNIEIGLINYDKAWPKR